jgi:hypothetical protein
MHALLTCIAVGHIDLHAGTDLYIYVQYIYILTLFL